jgi:hypothetical protein
LHSALDFYLYLVLNDIEITDKERESITLTRQDYREMSAPLATYAAKNKWARKHGREIIGAADSIEAMLALGMWMRRVNRVAKAHRNEKVHKRAEKNVTQHMAQHAPAAPLTATRPSGEQLAAMAQANIDQQQQTPSPVFERSANGHPGPSATEGFKPQPPDPGFGIVNPGTG